MAATSEDSRPLVFISHKHADSLIADAIRMFITMNSGGRVQVFQSSSAAGDSTVPGLNIKGQLKTKLWKATVVILVYTSEDKDWNWCMWECGVATHPQSADTKIIVLQCGATPPPVFADQLNINARDLVGVQKFTNRFLTSPDLFPTLGGPLTGFPAHGQEVATLAADFTQKLAAVLPPEKEDPSEEWPVFPFVQFELGNRDLDSIRKAEPKDRSKLAAEIIPKGCLISASDKYAEQLFGMPSFHRGTCFKELADTWREKYPDSQSRWIEGLSAQILDGVMWRFPRPTWELLQGLDDDNWYAPILNRVRKIPDRQCMQFDVYFFKFNLDAQTQVASKIPRPPAAEP